MNTILLVHCDTRE